MSWSMLKGDMRDVLPLLETASVDSIVTDPPYGLGFMGKGWDSFGGKRQPGVRGGNGSLGVISGYGRGGKTEDRISYRYREALAFQSWVETWVSECLRVLRPGGYLVAFGGTRTYHRLACAVEDGGFEIRDQLQWLYGQGFPKSQNVERAVATSTCTLLGRHFATKLPNDQLPDDHVCPATPESQAWDGFGSALKPAHEPIVLARKPFKGTVAANVLAHGTGALNVDGCRVGTSKDVPASVSRGQNGSALSGSVDRSLRRETGDEGGHDPNTGRWPANVVLGHHEECRLVGFRSVASNGHFPAAGPQGSQVSGPSGHAGQDDLEERHTRGETVDVWECVDDCPVRLLDTQTGMLTSGANPARRGTDGERTECGAFAGQKDANPQRGADQGGASRFYYCAKTSTSERNLGLPEGMKNRHSTVKPIALMRWLTRLVTPPGGLCLDPFGGSGSTGCAAVLEGFDFLGVELAEEDQTVIDVANYRISYWDGQRS